jgi:beta-glucosidase
MDGEEVVQLYVTGSDQNAPVRALKGFKRIFLKKGESRIVSFALTPEDLSLMDGNGNPKRFSGKVLISVGGSQPDALTVKSKKTIQGYMTMR